MSSKPSGLEYWPPNARRRVLDSAQVETRDSVVHIKDKLECNRTELVEVCRLAQRSNAEIARANRELVERNLLRQQELGEGLIGGLRDIVGSLDALETSLSVQLEKLNDTASAAVSGVNLIADMLFHFVTGLDYKETLRQRAAEAAESERQRTIIADYNEALDLIKDASTEKNVSKQRLQLEQAELCLRKALSVPAIEAQAAMDLGTLLFAGDGNLAEVGKCYEQALRRYEKWSPQWVYASRLLANVESRAGSPKRAYERMEEIINYRTSLRRFRDEVCGINCDDDYDARVKRLAALISEISSLGGANAAGVAEIEARLNSGKKITAVESLQKAEPQLLTMFAEALPDPDVFYDAARFAADCGMQAEATQHLQTRSALYRNDRFARRAFLLQVQATPEFPS